MEITWHAMTSEQVVDQLQVPVQNGLTTEEATRRLAKYGPNQLQEAPRRSFIMLVIDQLKSLVIILLIIASVISALLGETVDAIAIISIVILNAVLGVVQESRAEQALAALKKLAAPEAQVLRDGHRTSIPARDLVPGDVVFLEAGNFIPADIRLLEAVNLKVEEAALTGESTAVQKNAAAVLLPDAPLGDRKNTVFMGTVVSYGRGHGVVASTGMHTQLGLIATMLATVEQEETPLQKRLDDLGKTLVYGSLIVVALVFIIGFIRALDTIGGWSQIFTEHGLQEIVDLFMIAVSLAIAAVPEGLPAVVTISLALGMQEMVRRHALIRRLSSVETLGSATVICSDKTGTLTQIAMTVTRIWVDGHFIDISGTGYKPEGEFFHEGKKIDMRNYPGALTALWIGTLNNDAQLDQFTSEDGEITHRIAVSYTHLTLPTN
jgi:Ca2+-transporting ATPase